MTCNFTAISTVFQSYQDNGWVTVKGCVQWNLVYSISVISGQWLGDCERLCAMEPCLRSENSASSGALTRGPLDMKASP